MNVLNSKYQSSKSNDELLKLDSFLEGLLNKLLRAMNDLVDDFEPQIMIDHSISKDESVPPHVYLKYFQWDEDYRLVRACGRIYYKEHCLSTKYDLLSC